MTLAYRYSLLLLQMLSLYFSIYVFKFLPFYKVTHNYPCSQNSYYDYTLFLMVGSHTLFHISEYCFTPKTVCCLCI